MADANFHYSESSMTKLLQESSVAMHYTNIQQIERVVKNRNWIQDPYKKDILFFEQKSIEAALVTINSEPMIDLHAMLTKYTRFC